MVTPYLVLPTVSLPTMTTLRGRVTVEVPPLKMASKYSLTAFIPPVTIDSGGCSHGFPPRSKCPPSLSRQSRREANATGRAPRKSQNETQHMWLGGNMETRAIDSQGWLPPTQLTSLYRPGHQPSMSALHASRYGAAVTSHKLLRCELGAY